MEVFSLNTVYCLDIREERRFGGYLGLSVEGTHSFYLKIELAS